MHTGLRLSKITAVVAALASLAITGAPRRSPKRTRPLTRLTLGKADEVYILDEDGVKIWPVTAAYVSMGEGQRFEVDKCVPVGDTLRLWDDDGALNPNDFMGSTKILAEETRDEYFDNGSSRHRLGVVA
jgi:hypothetical protein